MSAPAARPERAPDLVLLGNLLVDDVVFRDGRTRMGEAGGAMLYVALAARLWDLGVGLVTVAGTDYPAAALDLLRARGVDLAGVRPLGRPGVRTWLLDEPAGRRVIHHRDRPSHREVSPSPADVPAEWRGARAFHLAPMPLDLQVELVAALAEGADAGTPFVSLDPHESVAPETLAAWTPALRHADAFFASADELRLAPPAADHPDLAAACGARLRFMVEKRGADGGVLVDRRAGRTHAWRPAADAVVDTTGAGDAFAGGFLAGWLTHGDVERALRQAVVSASFAIADWGSNGLARATPEQARDRLRAWFGAAAAA